MACEKGYIFIYFSFFIILSPAHTSLSKEVYSLSFSFCPFLFHLPFFFFIHPFHFHFALTQQIALFVRGFRWLFTVHSSLKGCIFVSSYTY